MNGMSQLTGFRPADWPALPAHAALSAPSYNGSYPYRLLIVDDESAQRRLAREILEPPKYEVIEAASGEAALALIAAHDFDTVLLDKRMAGLSGDEVCRRVRQDLKLHMLPIIMVTGSGATVDASFSLQAGATDFVRKPYDAVELVARVDSAVQHKRLTDQLENAESLLFALARMVEAKDENTGDHCTRLSRQAVRFGRWLGLTPKELLALRRGGILHDIGKLGIPESILLKPGALTPQEWIVMRTHTVIGQRLCQGLRGFQLTTQIIRSHHERWDGSGYPDALIGEDIPLLARVFQLCDIYDALSHTRPYKPALSEGDVMRVMEEEAARGWRDPTLIAAFRAFLATRVGQGVVDDADDDLGLRLYEDIAREAPAMGSEGGRAGDGGAPR